MAKSKEFIEQFRKYTHGIPNLFFGPELLRHTVETFFFKKHAASLASMYDQINQESNNQFKNKVSVLKKVPLVDLLDDLEIHTAFRLKAGPDHEQPEIYQTAVDEVSRLSFVEHPLDKAVE